MVKDYGLMAVIAEAISKLLEDYDCPNDEWIKGNVIYAKTLIRNVQDPQYEGAITLLKQVAQILPPLALPQTPAYDIHDYVVIPEAQVQVPRQARKYCASVEAAAAAQMADFKAREESSSGLSQAAPFVSATVLDQDMQSVLGSVISNTPQHSPVGRSNAAAQQMMDYSKDVHHTLRTSTFRKHADVCRMLRMTVTHDSHRRTRVRFSLDG